MAASMGARSILFFQQRPNYDLFKKKKKNFVFLVFFLMPKLCRCHYLCNCSMCPTMTGGEGGKRSKYNLSSRFTCVIMTRYHE